MSSDQTIPTATSLPYQCKGGVHDTSYKFGLVGVCGRWPVTDRCRVNSVWAELAQVARRVENNADLVQAAKPNGLLGQVAAYRLLDPLVRDLRGDAWRPHDPGFARKSDLRANAA